MKSTLIVLIVYFLSTCNNRILAQAGSLDQTFGIGGKVTTKFADTIASKIFTTVIQPDGKIIAAGNITPDLEDFDFVLVRYNSNGIIDSSFGTNGVAVTKLSPYWDAIYSIALQNDGKIVAGGSTYAQGGNFALVRYLSNGTIDSSFGNNGIVVLNNDPSFYGNAIAIQEGNKIVAAGFSSTPSTSLDFSCIRVTSNGRIDSTFGTNGEIKVDFNQQLDYCNSIALQKDGKILLGGYSGYTTPIFALARISADGQPDLSFGIRGTVTTNIGSIRDAALFIYGQSDGKLLLCGMTTPIENKTNFACVRYLSNGNIDSTFGTNGIVTTEFANHNAEAFSIAMQTDKKILATGTISSDSENSNFGIVRYNIDGTLDTTYGTNGTILIDFDGGDDQALCSAIQKDNKLIVAGVSLTTGYYHFALARLNAFTNSLPITFSSFSATKKQTSVLLNWQTANEQNNAYFIIERSNNSNNNFKEVGKVNSKGNSYKPQQYSFEDYSPFNGGNYYRLKQVDANGKSTYSKVVFIDFSKANTIKLYPNPVKDIITLEGLKGTTNISIISLQGSVLAKATANSSTYTWNIKQLPPGTYYVSIEAGKNVTILKFIKE
jgi:uncharacterized delta-60 repeat protein